jgi:ribosomal protein L37E
MTDEADRAAIKALEQDPERTNRMLRWLVHLIGHTSCTGYAIAVTDGHVRTITCLRCGCSSFNQSDIDQKYCGHCASFHEDAR